MATKFNLTVSTPLGTFTRCATKPYTHAVVRTSALAAADYANRDNLPAWKKSGVTGRWIKDGGHILTWHGSEAAARAAAAKPYGYDTKATVAGVYAVYEQ